MTSEAKENPPIKTGTSSIIVDARGIPIKPLSIVGMSESDGKWSQYKGLVVDPWSTIEGEGYCVAVYFYKEVCSSNFWNRDRQRVIPIEKWDHCYAQNDRKSETDFLFVNDVWKKSPRVVFFQPEELIVLPSWDIETLAERMFKNNYHTVFDLPPKLPQDPKSYMCWIDECKNPATDIALYNYWGSVCPYFVCKQCRPGVNGICGETPPKTKKSLMTPDGKIITLTLEAKGQ